MPNKRATPRRKRTDTGHKSDLSNENEMHLLIPLSQIEVEFEGDTTNTYFEDVRFLRRLCSSHEFHLVGSEEVHLLNRLQEFGIPHDVDGPDDKGRLFVRIKPGAGMREVA